MEFIRCAAMWQGIIWNHPNKCVSSYSLDSSFSVSVLMCRPIASDLAEAPMRASCYFKRKCANVPSEFRASKWLKFCCNGNQSVAGTNGIPVLITVNSEDALHIVSNCQMLVPRTSSSTCCVVSTQFSF